jgi:two-component system NtrC family sensor kinase
MSPSTAELHQMASIGRLLAGIVHEINTPLGSVFSNNEVLRRSLEILGAMLAQDDAAKLDSAQLAKARQILSTLQQLAAVDQIACERIRAVIRGLKTFARTDGTAPRKADLNQHLRDTLKLTQAEFRKRVAVETDFAELPEVEFYPQMLSQVFLNLLVNAGQAIEGQGTIKVRTQLENGGETVHVSIADSGRGMTPEQQEKAFRAGFTTKAVGEGTGLGLSIAKEIVEEKHGGSITFESQLGVGTTFHIRIPVRQTRSQQP